MPKIRVVDRHATDQKKTLNRTTALVRIRSCFDADNTPGTETKTVRSKRNKTRAKPLSLFEECELKWHSIGLTSFNMYEGINVKPGLWLAWVKSMNQKCPNILLDFMNSTRVAVCSIDGRMDVFVVSFSFVYGSIRP